MANKIRDIFSDGMFSLESQIRFKNKESYNDFQALLEKVYDDGNSYQAKGIDSMSISIQQNGKKYPLEEHTNISGFVVGPAVESVSIPLLVNNLEKEITFTRYETRDKVVVKSMPDAIICFQFDFSKTANKHSVTFNAQLEKAKTLDEIIESYLIAETLFDKLFVAKEQPAEDNQIITIWNIKQRFHNYSRFYGRIHALAEEFNLSISPSRIKSLSAEEQQTIDELYLLLVDKKTVKLNGKLSYDDSTSFTVNSPSSDITVGKSYKLVFLGTRDYTILDQTVKIYTANLLSNMIVREIKKESDGSTKVLYGDVDSNPMFISYSAYKTEADASIECKSIVDHEDNYTMAEYSNVYIQQYYSI